jgi:hypothetical protein
MRFILLLKSEKDIKFKVLTLADLIQAEGETMF